MATSEDQPKAIVRDFATVIIRFLHGRDQPGRGVRFKFFVEPCPAPDTVNGFMPSGLNDPGTWGIRDARARPLVNSSCKRLLHRLFGHVEVTHKPNQGRDDSSPIGAINGINSCICFRKHTQV
jgi:hypothetical protein